MIGLTKPRIQTSVSIIDYIKYTGRLPSKEEGFGMDRDKRYEGFKESLEEVNNQNYLKK